MTSRFVTRAQRLSAEHLGALEGALGELRAEATRLDAWGRRLADVLLDGGRLLACGNGGSAAEAQHLTAELVGRYQDERRPLSALALHAESSSFTAIGNDYGSDACFARQVRAHGRAGDVLLALSTSGSSPNVLAAAEAARECGMVAWALTGEAPNPLAGACDDAVCVAGPTPTVQEAHLVAVHLLCAAVDRRVFEREPLLRPVEVLA
ncbi:MAG TPA: SIS domain-containing protein [Baekduia sp.]|nr:SIS domain-containing protein [Baekduia sp.]